MALTAKPISTISYNNESFLKRKLDAMMEAHIITDYRYIKHDGEDGDKDHIHLLMYPNKRLDTGVLREEFNEVTAEADAKPLGCLPFRTSNTDHWLMYVLHDPFYLMAHHSDDDGDGKIEYQIDQIVTPFKEQLARDYKRAIPLRKTENQEVVERLMRGDTIVQILTETTTNPMKIATIKNLMLQEMNMTERVKIEEQNNAIRKLATELGKVLVSEELPQTKADRKMGIEKEFVEQYELDYATGEVKRTDRYIRNKKEVQDDEE